MTDHDAVVLSSADRHWDSAVGADLAFLMARANARSLAGVSAALKPFRLKVRSFAVLSLATEQDRLSQRDLAEFLRLDPSQIVSLVDGLEKAGWVRREPDPDDRRAKLIVATAAGRTVHAQARAASDAWERELFADLDPAQLEQLVAVLRTIAEVPDLP